MKLNQQNKNSKKLKYELHEWDVYQLQKKNLIITWKMCTIYRIMYLVIGNRYLKLTSTNLYIRNPSGRRLHNFHLTDTMHLSYRAFLSNLLQQHLFFPPFALAVREHTHYEAEIHRMKTQMDRL